MLRKLTTIDLPHGAMGIVGDILDEADFTPGTIGGGMCEMERDGEISEEEKAELTKKMAKALFNFEVQDLEEEDEEETDAEYLLGLSERIFGIAVEHGVDQGDYDRLREIANRMSEGHRCDQPD